MEWKCEGFALTEHSEGEFGGQPGLVVIVVLADKHRLVISVVGDGVGEKDTSIGWSSDNFGQLLVTARYRQADVAVYNHSIRSSY